MFARIGVTVAVLLFLFLCLLMSLNGRYQVVTGRDMGMFLVVDTRTGHVDVMALTPHEKEGRLRVRVEHVGGD